MLEIDQAVIACCLRANYEQFGFSTLKQLADAIANNDRSLAANVNKCIYLQSFSDTTVPLLCLKYIADNFHRLILKNSNFGLDGYRYIATLIDTHIRDVRTNFVHTAFLKWINSERYGDKVLLSGVYQIYRRTKAIVSDMTDAQSGDMMIACELLYINSNTLECILISTNQNIYRGIIHINAESNAHFFLFRNDDHDNGIVCRNMYVSLDGRMGISSAIMLRTGSHTSLPISSDCLIVYVPKALHVQLYSDIDSLLTRNTNYNKSDCTSVMSEYLTAPLPEGPRDDEDPAWKDVHYVNEFPFIEKMISDPDIGNDFFRVSSRAINQPQLNRFIQKHGRLGVFKKSRT